MHMHGVPSFLDLKACTQNSQSLPVWPQTHINTSGHCASPHTCKTHGQRGTAGAGFSQSSTAKQEPTSSETPHKDVCVASKHARQKQTQSPTAANMCNLVLQGCDTPKGRQGSMGWGSLQGLGHCMCWAAQSAHAPPMSHACMCCLPISPICNTCTMGPACVHHDAAAVPIMHNPKTSPKCHQRCCGSCRVLSGGAAIQHTCLLQH